MVRGQVANIPSGTGVLLTTLSHEQKNSMAILNPNDGVVYLKMNSPASIAPTNWDWKLPSQSYGQYPGPWQSLGLYYQDQSGSNASGQVNLYESDAELAIPSIVAIGRAAQVAGTQVDITQGTIPQNPPQSTTRLWVDTAGHLHLLDSTGSDKTVVDSNNISSYVTPLIAATALGGDLYGTIPNGHVWAHTNPVQLDRTVNVQWGTNSTMDRITIWSDTNMYIDVTGVVNVRPNSGATVLVIGSSGLTVTGVVTASGAISAVGTLTANSANSPATLQNTALSLFGGEIVIQRWNPNQVRFSNSGGITVLGDMHAEGTASVGTSLTVGTQLTAQNINGTNSVSSSTGAIDAAQWIRSQSGSCYFGTTGTRIDMDATNVVFRGPNGSGNQLHQHLDGTWMGTQAANFQVQSSVNHAKLYKKPIEPITNAEEIVTAIDPVYYYHIIMKEDDTPLTDELDGYYTYGFAPSQVAEVMPEVVSGDFIDYNRMIPALWAAVKELYARPKNTV